MCQVMMVRAQAGRSLPPPSWATGCGHRRGSLSAFLTPCPARQPPSARGTSSQPRGLTWAQRTGSALHTVGIVGPTQAIQREAVQAPRTEVPEHSRAPRPRHCHLPLQQGTWMQLQSAC